MRDLASEVGVRTGLSPPMSDEELRRAVIGKAKRYKIELTPDEVTVWRTKVGDRSILHLSADYKVPVSLVIASFRLHFAPSSLK